MTRTRISVLSAYMGILESGDQMTSHITPVTPMMRMTLRTHSFGETEVSLRTRLLVSGKGRVSEGE